MSQMITPTTELEAVNEMLKASGLARASTLAGDVGEVVASARSTLHTTNRAIQMEGWSFNEEDKYPLTPDMDGNINLPAGVLKLKKSPWDHHHVDPVVRGSRLYDRRNHTYNFSGTLLVTLTQGLSFDELPAHARHYITMSAVRKYQTEEVQSDVLYRFTAGDEIRAKSAFLNAEAETQSLNMGGTPFLASIRNS